MSSGYDRLVAIYEAYSKAYDRRTVDWAQANSSEQARVISDHLDQLETHYLAAAKQSLDATGDAVEAAYDAAQEAQAAIEKAYESAKGIAEKIRLVGSIVTKIGDLIELAHPG